MGLLVVGDRFPEEDYWELDAGVFVVDLLVFGGFLDLGGEGLGGEEFGKEKGLVRVEFLA